MNVCARSQLLSLPETSYRRSGVRHPQKGFDRRMNVHHDPPQGPVLSPDHPRTVLVHEQRRPSFLHQYHYRHHPHGTEERVNRTQVSRHVDRTTHDVTRADDALVSSFRLTASYRKYQVSPRATCPAVAQTSLHLLNRAVHVSRSHISGASVLRVPVPILVSRRTRRLSITNSIFALSIFNGDALGPIYVQIKMEVIRLPRPDGELDRVHFSTGKELPHPSVNTETKRGIQ